MINCGAILDLNEIMTLEDDQKVYIVDSHRPINLRNAFGSSQVSVADLLIDG